MPYITQDKRKKFDSNITELIAELSEDPDNICGNLNYIITKLILFHFESGVNYQKINDINGVLDSCKSEFYRRLAGPYEDLKIDVNGDVYDKIDFEYKSIANKENDE